MDKAQAIHSLWSRFLPAYDQNTVPDQKELQAEGINAYITYDVIEPADFETTVQLTAKIYMRDTGWAAIERKKIQIAEYIGQGGRITQIDGGYAYITRSETFAQRGSDPDPDMRVYVIHVDAEFLTED